jgi:hypothetical protein
MIACLGFSLDIEVLPQGICHDALAIGIGHAVLLSGLWGMVAMAVAFWRVIRA